MDRRRSKHVLGVALGAALLGWAIPTGEVHAATRGTVPNPYVTGVTVSAYGLTFTAKATTARRGLQLEYQFREKRHGHWLIVRRFSSSNSITLSSPKGATAIDAYALTRNQVAHKQWNQAVKAVPVAVPKLRQAGLPVTVAAVAGSDGTAAAAIVNDIVYSSAAAGTADNGDTVMVSQGAGPNLPSSATFAGGVLDITIGTDSTGASLATSNTNLLMQVQDALNAGSITGIKATLETGALASAAPAVAGSGTFAGGSGATDGADILTVEGGAAYMGTLRITVTSGSTLVGTAVVPVTSGESAASVAEAIAAAFNGPPYTDVFAVANPSSGIVTLTQAAPSSQAIGVTVSG